MPGALLDSAWKSTPDPSWVLDTNACLHTCWKILAPASEGAAAKHTPAATIRAPMICIPAISFGHAQAGLLHGCLCHIHFVTASCICSFRKAADATCHVARPALVVVTNADRFAKHMDWGACLDSPVHAQDSSLVPSMTMQSGKE